MSKSWKRVKADEESKHWAKLYREKKQIRAFNKLARDEQKYADAYSVHDERVYNRAGHDY